MPNCNLIGCGFKRSRNQPNITLHQLPANENKKKIWLETIESLNMSLKTIHICSLHFGESCFNRTLNKVTLRDEALSSRTLLVHAFKMVKKLKDKCQKQSKKLKSLNEIEIEDRRKKYL